MSLNAEPFDDAHYVLMESEKVIAVAMRCGDLVEYVLPLVWERRYELAARMVSELLKSRPALRSHIKEDLPSHASWYAALLPALGFEMTPRMRMGAETTALVLQNGGGDERYRLAGMENRWRDSCVAVHLNAFEVPPLRIERKKRNIERSLDAPDRLASWTLALHGDEIVGSCFGSHHRARLFIEELAVSRDHRNQGLGRRLLLECVRKLAQASPEAATVVLDVDRMNGPAVALYAGLGFARVENYTVAQASP